METSRDRIPFLIVGGGLAGAKAAEALREERAEGRVVLLSAEAERPYNRPPLTKDFLRGETKKDDVYVHPPEWAKEHDVELRLNTMAERLDPQAGTVTLQGGETLVFERLLLATGARPKVPPIPGRELEGVLVLRTLRDAEAIRRAAEGKRRAVMVGGGFIGAEVAASLRQVGLETAVVAQERTLWSHLFGEQMGHVFQRKLEENKVEVLTGDSVQSIEGTGRAQRVVTKNGRTLECDLVVMGVGVAPETGLAERGGLQVENGVVTDQYLQTSQPGIYAAGDIARYYSPLYEARLRVEHWDVAQQHGTIAGRNMAREAAGKAGQREAFDQPPYFYSDLFDLAMEYLGHNEGWDDLVVRGDERSYEQTAFYLKGGRLVAALFLNRNPDVDPTRALLQRRLEVDAQVRKRLADPAVELQALAGSV